MGLSTRLGLQNRPDVVTHRVQIGRVGRPLSSTDETQKMAHTPLLDGFRPMCWSGVLLEGPLLIAKVLIGPGKSHGLQNIPQVDVLVDFDAHIDEN